MSLLLKSPSIRFSFPCSWTHSNWYIAFIVQGLTCWVKWYGVWKSALFASVTLNSLKARHCFVLALSFILPTPFPFYSLSHAPTPVPIPLTWLTHIQYFDLFLPVSPCLSNSLHWPICSPIFCLGVSVAAWPSQSYCLFPICKVLQDRDCVCLTFG